MLLSSCSHRPGVCITRPNFKARSDEIWYKGLEIFRILTKLNYLSTLYVGTSVLRWAGWATVMYGRVGKLKTRVGKWKNFFGALRRILSNKCLPTVAWNPAGTPDYCPCFTNYGLIQHFSLCTANITFLYQTSVVHNFFSRGSVMQGLGSHCRPDQYHSLALCQQILFH